MKPNIELHIEELALHGFAPGDRLRIGEAIQQELTRLLTESGLPPSLLEGQELPHLDGGTFAARQGVSPRAIGGGVARAVYGGLNR